VGKVIAKLIDEKSNKTAYLFYKNHLKNVISSACLAHDIGNPAFGHSGEDAISKFFVDKETNKPEDIAFKNLFKDYEWSDLIGFEGNANSLRILTKKSHGRLDGSYRLTYSTLGAILKYPCESLATNEDLGIHRKKYGFFHIDKEVFIDVATKLNMIREDVKDRIVYKRHPFVFLVEAADDICYNIIDFEDAHRLGILKFETVKENLLALIKLDKEENYKNVEANLEIIKDDENETIAYLRAKAINYLTKRCSEIFLDKKDEIIIGNFNNDLISEILEAKEVIKNIKNISKKYIYNAYSVSKIEIAGFRIMSGLIEDFIEAALTPEKDRQKRHKKVLNLLPSQYKFDEASTPYTKVMHIIDFVSGMTDLYALKMYKNMRGIEIPAF
jgi:dGTPase